MPPNVTIAKSLEALSDSVQITCACRSVCVLSHGSGVYTLVETYEL